MTAPMTLHGSTLPTYIVKCTFNCSYQLDNTLTADLKKKNCIVLYCLLRRCFSVAPPPPPLLVHHRPDVGPCVLSKMSGTSHHNDKLFIEFGQKCESAPPIIQFGISCREFSFRKRNRRHRQAPAKKSARTYRSRPSPWK
jgi:hypothetical protein